MFKWPPLESNPEVFTKYLHKIGLTEEWTIGEVFGFDEDLLAFLPKPILAVIVAFEAKGERQDKGDEALNSNVNFYMK